MPPAKPANKGLPGARSALANGSWIKLKHVGAHAVRKEPNWPLAARKKDNMKRMLAPLLTLALAASPLLGCSKDKESASAASESSKFGAILADPLLNKLPPSADLFYVLDASSGAYQKLKTSPFGTGLGTLQKSLEQMKGEDDDESQVAGLQILISTLQNLGLLSATGDSTFDQVISKAVVFAGISENAAQPLELGVYVAAAKGASLKSKLPILRQVLADSDFTVSAQQIAGVEGLVAKPPQSPDGSAQDISVYVAASDSLMAISVTQAGAESLFSSVNTDTVKKMSDSPDFKKATAALSPGASPLAFAYLDLKKMMPALEKVGAQNGLDKDDIQGLRELPFDGVAFAQGYDIQATSGLSVIVSGRNEAQTKLLSALEGASIPANLPRLPADTAVAFGLDTRFVAKLDEFLDSIEQPEGASAVKQAQDVQGLTFGIRSGDGSSPLPDIFLVVDSANRDAIASQTEALIGQGMAGAAGVAPQWSTKDVDGSPTKYMQTMFGAGVYMSAPKGSNSLLIGSSERAVRDLLESASGKKSGIVDALQATLKDSLSPSKLASLYLNAAQAASLIESVKSTLATFAGPSPELDEALNTAALKKLGFVTGSLSYSNGLFVVESAYDAASAR